MSRLALCAVALTCALTAPATASASPDYASGFEGEAMVSGLTRPTVVDWTPDGRTLVSEQDGRLKVLDPGASTARTVLDIHDQVNTGGDRGLLGMAVDSDFQSNGYVYLLYTYELKPLTPDTLDPMVAQLLRIRLDANSNVIEQQVILGSHTSGVCPAPSNIVDCIPSDSDSHSIGTVRAAPDGSLYVGAGDGAGYNSAEQLAFRSYDEQSLAGKILHVDRDGRGLPGHPFCPTNADLSNVCTKLWAKGFRNPFRFALSPSGGLIVGDVGWGTREEINLIESGGGSYGWPCIEGTYAGNSYANDPKCQPGPLGPQIAPVYDYAHPGDGGGSAVVGGPRYTGSEYPAAYQGAIIFGDYGRGLLRRLRTGGPGAPTPEPFAEEWWGDIDVESAPDNGDIVFVSFGEGDPGTGSVERIVYSPGNGRPTAHATASPTFSFTLPLTVAFDAQAAGQPSTDPDGDPLSYSWDFGDGTSSDEVAPTHEYTEQGTYQAVLTVDDGRGKSDSDSVTITAGNTPPDVPEIDYAPTYRGGGQIVLHGSATDPEEGALDPQSALRWDVKLVHSDHVHPFFHERPGADLQFLDPASHDADSYYEVRLTATDAGDLSTTNVVELHPETTTITIASEPPGARVAYYDATFAAPLTRLTAIGLQTGISAEERFGVDGREYVFSSWSDGGERIHSLTVPDAPTTLVARYTAVAGPPAPDPDPPATDPDPPRRGPAPVPKPPRRGPALSLTSSQPLGRAQSSLRGTARDPDGVKSVFGAVYRRTANGRCRFWAPARRRALAPRRCGRPLWIKAKLTGKPANRRWRLALRAPLPAGSYRLRLRAYDRAGARSDRVGRAASLRIAAR